MLKLLASVPETDQVIGAVPVAVYVAKTVLVLVFSMIEIDVEPETVGAVPPLLPLFVIL
jgi:hypothetical protein